MLLRPLFFPAFNNGDRLRRNQYLFFLSRLALSAPPRFFFFSRQSVMVFLFLSFCCLAIDSPNGVTVMRDVE
jgi:hypothetical protein